MTLDLVMGVFVWLLGLCVGSFLNVVVYRLPRGVSVNRPSRSFCPRCSAPIAWYDNIPVLSWLLLGARCRHCGAAISVQYALVEAATGLSFVLVYYLLFVANARVGANQLVHPYDWPLLAAWLVLTAVLIACAVMDLDAYMVDVRITHVAVVAGTLLLAIWPHAGFVRPVARLALGAASLAAFAASVFMLWWTVWRLPEEPGTTADADHGDREGADARANEPSPPAWPVVALGIVGVLMFTGLAGWLLTETALSAAPTIRPASALLPDDIEPYATTTATSGFAPDLAVPAALATLFGAMVLAGSQPRAADAEIQDAIDEEQHGARREALSDLLWLLPSLAAGGIVWAALLWQPAWYEAWRAAASYSVASGFAPLAGVTYAIAGMTAGAAVGWTLRIVFTLVFGKEAFGVGDIYILAAIGACAGWDIALLAMLFAVGAAITGYLFSLLLKRTGIIPFGPWLAVGTLAALWLNLPAAHIAEDYYKGIVAAWHERPEVCLVSAGLMLVGTGAAIVIARLTRRLVESADN